MHQTPARRPLRTLAVVLTLAAVPVVAGATGALAQPSTTKDGITRTALAETSPGNAPGQELYLQEVRIAPGAKLAVHLHEGTQVASVRSGVLTYNIVSGTATVTRADGTVAELTGPKTIRLRPRDVITETATVVHYGANATKKPVVILVAALLVQGAPLATPVSTP